jgi:hypothetical protein
MHLQVAIDEPQKNPAHGGFKCRIVRRACPESAEQHLALTLIGRNSTQ